MSIDQSIYLCNILDPVYDIAGLAQFRFVKMSGLACDMMWYDVTLLCFAVLHLMTPRSPLSYPY